MLGCDDAAVAEIDRLLQLEVRILNHLGEVCPPLAEGRFRLTGIEVDGPFGSILALSEGRIVSATGYATPGQAKKAAGMPRPGSTAEARRYAPRP